MFAPLCYGLIFFGIVAVNHRFGKSYEEKRAGKRIRAQRRSARYDKNRAEEEKQFQESAVKRREARREKRDRERRREEAGGMWWEK